MKLFKPMLASPAELDALRYPLYASPKLDGIRALVRGGRLVSRKMLDIPNRSIWQRLEFDKPTKVANDLTGGLSISSLLEGLDGELIVGDPTATNVYTQTTSFVMARDKVGQDFTFHVFDHHDHPGDYEARLLHLFNMMENLGAHPVRLHHQTLIHNRIELDAFEEFCVGQGYEGIMTRDPKSHYKHGRSTAKEQIMLKIKRFEDSEAEVLGVVEEMFNGNAAEKDAFGRTKRSSAKAGKVGKGTMGALNVRDVKTGVEFQIGSGFTAAQRAEEWPVGELVKYAYFPVGVKDKPRHPVFKGRRSPIDL